MLNLTLTHFNYESGAFLYLWSDMIQVCPDGIVIDLLFFHCKEWLFFILVILACVPCVFPFVFQILHILIFVNYLVEVDVDGFGSNLLEVLFSEPDDRVVLLDVFEVPLFLFKQQVKRVLHFQVDPCKHSVVVVECVGRQVPPLLLHVGLGLPHEILVFLFFIGSGFA